MVTLSLFDITETYIKSKTSPTVINSGILKLSLSLEFAKATLSSNFRST